MGKITDASGREIAATHTVPSIKGARPTGNVLLVELLTDNEIMGTTLTLPGGKAKDGQQPWTPQAYVLEVGHLLKEDELRIHKGDRIAFSGSFIPLPNYGNGHRLKGIIEPHAVKVVFTENV